MLAVNRLLWENDLWFDLPDEATRALLFETGSLTQALTQQCGQSIRVQVLFEGMIQDRAVCSAHATDGCWVREVVLWCRDKPVLYALSHVALPCLQARQAFVAGHHAFSALQQLGNQPLGYWLARQDDLVRHAFTYALVSAHQLEDRILSVLAGDMSARQLPARRSQLDKGGESLALIEVFL